MSVECPTGFSPDPEARQPSKPADSTTLQANNTYVRLRYEWERVDNTRTCIVWLWTAMYF